MPDARIIRTRNALHASISELAATKPVTDITVSELATHAGINRVTFYKHYGSPAEVLNEFLERDLATVRAHFLANVTSRPETTEEALVATAHLVLDHVERNRAIYLLAIGTPQDGTVPNMLAGHVADTIRQYLAQHPELTPPDSDLDALISIRFMSRGLAGAVEAWLLSGTDDRSGFIDSTLAFVPGWLFRTDS